MTVSHKIKLFYEIAKKKRGEIKKGSPYRKLGVYVKKYKEGYEVKFSLRIEDCMQCAGGGWYEFSHYENRCYPARIKHERQRPSEEELINSIEELPLNLQHLLSDSIKFWETSDVHTNLLRSSCKIKKPTS